MALAAASASAQTPVGAAPASPAAPDAAAARPEPATQLAPGDRGKAVRVLQRRLELRADGHFGPRTERALKRWQGRRDLPRTGIADAATLDRLGIRARVASRPTPSAAEDGDAAETLQAIARCESGGDPTAVSPDGRYHGKYQFADATWEAMGGSGSASDAPEDEQDERAAALLEQEGTQPWPVCGAKA